MTINLTELNAAAALVSTMLPQVATAYAILKTIWLRTNPGKTEADFVSYLGTASQANIDDTAALLKADGYIEQADGSWKKPTPSLLSGTSTTLASSAVPLPSGGTSISGT